MFKLRWRKWNPLPFFKVTKMEGNVTNTKEKEHQATYLLTSIALIISPQESNCPYSSLGIILSSLFLLFNSKLFTSIGFLQGWYTHRSDSGCWLECTSWRHSPGHPLDPLPPLLAAREIEMGEQAGKWVVSHNCLLLSPLFMGLGRWANKVSKRGGGQWWASEAGG